MEKNTLIVIPARLSSQRLHQKPLALLHGQPLVLHTWKKACNAQIGPVIVATDSVRVARHIRCAGGQTVLTKASLPSGSDRVWQACEIFDPLHTFTHIVNLQGDLPIFPENYLNKLNLPKKNFDILTLAKPLHDQDWGNPHTVKVGLKKDDTTNNIGKAQRFVRKIPHQSASLAWFHHIGVYAFKREALKKFVTTPATADEKKYKLEQLRAWKAQLSIGVRILPQSTWISVDTQTDLNRANEYLERNHIASA